MPEEALRCKLMLFRWRFAEKTRFTCLTFIQVQLKPMAAIVAVLLQGPRDLTEAETTNRVV